MVEITNSKQVTMPFALSCWNCGATDDTTPEDAIGNGWSAITEDEDGLSWNYVGTCPECDEETLK